MYTYKQAKYFKMSLVEEVFIAYQVVHLAHAMSVFKQTKSIYVNAAVWSLTQNSFAFVGEPPTIFNHWPCNIFFSRVLTNLLFNSGEKAQA